LASSNLPFFVTYIFSPPPPKGVGILHRSDSGLGSDLNFALSFAGAAWPLGHLTCWLESLNLIRGVKNLVPFLNLNLIVMLSKRKEEVGRCVHYELIAKNALMRTYPFCMILSFRQSFLEL
jgi:hypothetical protein